MSTDSLKLLLARVPSGYSQVLYRNRRYGLTRSDFNGGRSSKIYAEALAGDDHVSLNYYQVQQREYLCPCEMSERKVLDFLREFQLPESPGTL